MCCHDHKQKLEGLLSCGAKLPIVKQNLKALGHFRNLHAAKHRAVGSQGRVEEAKWFLLRQSEVRFRLACLPEQTVLLLSLSSKPSTLLYQTNEGEPLAVG